MQNALLYDGLRYWAKNTPGKLAVQIDDDITLTYAELDAWSDGVAARLQGEGVVPGDTVAVTGGTTLSWIAAAIGILKAGGAIVPYNTRLTPDDLGYLLKLARPRLVMADTAQTAVIQSLDLDIPILPLEQLSEHSAGAPAGWQPVRQDADALAMVIFTSGTTARPKGVMISHGQQLNKYFEMLLVEPQLGAASRIYMPLPLHASPGTQWGFVFSTTIGASLFVASSYDPAATVVALAKHRISAFTSISLFYEHLARTPEFAQADLSCISFAQAGGMRLTPQTIAAWRDKGVVIRQVYGLTEIGGVGIMASTLEAGAQPNACGRGMPFMKLRVLRPDGSEAAANEPGDVLLRGPGMMLGYLHNEEATAKAIIDGWMHTGDVGVKDEDGYFTFMDRRKDVISLPKGVVSPSEIESVIAELDNVVEVSVAGVTAARGQIICAWVRAASPIDPSEILRHCQDRLQDFKIPDQIVPMEAPLPRMISGKIDKGILVALFEN